MNVIESDLLYTARSGSEFTDPVPGLVQAGQAAPETEESVAGEMIIIITILATATQHCLRNYDFQYSTYRTLNIFDFARCTQDNKSINYRCQLNVELIDIHCQIVVFAELTKK